MTNKSKSIVFITLFVFFITTSCNQQMVNAILASATGEPLTEGKVADGLKQALSVGTDSAVSRLSRSNGFYQDMAVKILLPKEAQDIIVTLKSVDANFYKATLQPIEDKLTESLNRAAEDAAKEAAPIFKTAITEMTITDAFGILKGSDSSATSYLREKTYTNLFTAFQPKIDASLNKPLLGNTTTNQLWSSFTEKYNKFKDVYNLTATFTGKQPLAELNPNFSGYVTEQGLKGLFVKVKDLEADIRKNPLARVTTLLQEVFGKN
jgi:DNA-binding FrmR family transcriptional regulator